ncbi:hypothetical protein MPH_13876 [Macrophomina phaseolina MS6]|uniref:Uncharacterized protein n=1 Tax=Macrophomina phaseolina (strain MS6) TaxID=1126212 RepID=K2QHA1_MACPH|nr:hypothetical protein MPH_13876 [Macrophomina phaseolina MS6]
MNAQVPPVQDGSRLQVPVESGFAVSSDTPSPSSQNSWQTTEAPQETANVTQFSREENPLPESGSETGNRIKFLTWAADEQHWIVLDEMVDAKGVETEVERLVQEQAQRGKLAIIESAGKMCAVGLGTVAGRPLPTINYSLHQPPLQCFPPGALDQNIRNEEEQWRSHRVVDRSSEWLQSWPQNSASLTVPHQEHLRDNTTNARRYRRPVKMHGVKQARRLRKAKEEQDDEMASKEVSEETSGAPEDIFVMSD